MASRWLTVTLHDSQFEVLNLDHRAVERSIIADIDAGIEVYYDRRWSATRQFACWLQQAPARVADKSVFVIGAGVGLETLVIGRHCRQLFINDLSTTALTLCAEQLERNSILNVECCPGRYETLALPPVDLVVGSYLIYNADTRRAMARFLATYPGEVLLMNDRLAAFRALLKTTTRAAQPLFEGAAASCVRFSAGG